MRICVIGKYPPIQGGVSTTTYWLARGLAEAGHQIYVVTNAHEVEDAYRLQLTAEDRGWYEPAFERSGGFVKVFQPAGFSAAAMQHIPRSNPFVSKLAAVATDVVRHFDCDLVFSYYFEPYGVAGHLVSLWTKRPFALKHAGSDLDRLMKSASLATTYREVLRSATCLVTGRRHLPRFLGLGLALEAIYPDALFAHPREVFNSVAPPLDIDALAAGAPEPAQSGGRPFDRGKPTIGIYGKVGVVKGSFDLVATLGRLAREGLDFNFLAMTQGRESARFREALAANSLLERTWVVPFQPHWRVPGFINTCTAVCFLERDFPITIHGPMVPREILSCGAGLLLSGEIAGKQRYAAELRDRENVLLVADPKDHEALARQLRFVIEDPQRAREIGARGQAIAASFPPFSSFVRHHEELFLRCCGAESPARSFFDLMAAAPGVHGAAPQRSAALALGCLLPCIEALLQTDFDRLRARFCEKLNGHGGESAARLAIDFCAFAEDSPELRALRDELPCLPDVLRYQKARLRNELGDSEHPACRFNQAGQLGHPAPGGFAGLRPARSENIVVESFRFDVTPLFSGDLLAKHSDPGALRAAVRAIEPAPIAVAFQKVPNLKRREIKLGLKAHALLGLCDGGRSIEDIVALLRCGPAPATGDGRPDEVLTALGVLRDKMLISFEAPGQGH